MRGIKFLLIVSFFSFVFGPGHSILVAEEKPANVIANGSFENGLDEWSEKNGGEVIADKTAPEGKQVLMIDSSSGPNNITVERMVEITEPGEYTLTVYIKTENLKGVLGAFAGTKYVHLEQEKAVELYGYDVFFVKGTTDWKRYAHKFTLPEGIIRIRLYLRIGGEDTGKAYFDDVRIEKGDWVADRMASEKEKLKNQTENVPEEAKKLKR